MTVPLLLLAAATNPANPVTTTDEADKAGPIAVVVIALLCIACYFLFRSMSRHLRRVRENFPADAPQATSQPEQQDERQPR